MTNEGKDALERLARKCAERRPNSTSTEYVASLFKYSAAWGCEYFVRCDYRGRFDANALMRHGWNAPDSWTHPATGEEVEMFKRLLEQAREEVARG